MIFIIPLRFHSGENESIAFTSISSLLRNLEMLMLYFKDGRNKRMHDFPDGKIASLVPITVYLLNHEILLRPHDYFLCYLLACLP